MAEEGSFVSEEFGRQFWEERYNSHTAVWSSKANPQLVAEAGELVPGTALDAGCGEGADALWLAGRGWQVTAVDFAASALRRAREHAESLGDDVAGRIDWVQADLDAWAPPEEHFDLVTSHYVHSAASREALFRRLAAAVAPGGTLLIVGHHPTDPHSAAHAPAASVRFTAEEAADSLDPDRWDIAVAEARTRTATRPGGHEILIRDAVLRARKRV
jgi:SAM-dependent methyltransferase